MEQRALQEWDDELAGGAGNKTVILTLTLTLALTLTLTLALPLTLTLTLALSLALTLALTTQAPAKFEQRGDALAQKRLGKEASQQRKRTKMVEQRAL